jgi:hypothetical protein
LFWPYAAGAVFYYSLWPRAYADPVWSYGYGDIDMAVFPPDAYGGIAQLPGSRGSGRRPVYDEAARAALAKRMAAICEEEAAEVAGWPIDEIQEVVKPDERQRAALDALANATVKASEIIRAGCPTTASFTPGGRLDAMAKRVDALLQAVDIIRPSLQAFYASLNDDQKARFNAMGAPQGRQQAAGEDAESACEEGVNTLPLADIERSLHPTDAQRSKLQDLQTAAAKAADLVKASCPTATPETPPGRLDAVAKRLQAMRQAIRIVRPAVEDLYGSLDDEQKARFNALGERRRERS